jgi:hypothetical protein
MNLFVGIVGVVILAGVLIAWFLVYRRVQDDAGLLDSPKNRTRGVNELEQFIAAYRSGQVMPADLQSGAADRAQTAARPATPPGDAAPALQQGAFLSPEIKVGYLSLRAGLRDHHVFVHVRLADLGRGVASGRVDLLVCNPRFEPVAAIDIVRGEAAADPGKLAFLRNAGLRHLQLPASRMPKPEDLRNLVLGQDQ